jgi:hypothetical protein
VVSAWLAISFYEKQKYKQLSKIWDEEFESFEELGKGFPKQSANQAALELEKLCLSLGIDLAPKQFKNRARPEKEKREHVKLLIKDLSKILENRLNHESSERFDIPEELEKFFVTNQSVLEEIVSASIANESPVWELDLEKHISAPFPNLSGHLTLQRLINLKVSLLIEESKTSEAESMLEASWKINEHLLQRPEVISYEIGQNILKLQLGNLRVMKNLNTKWYERISNPDIETHIWKVLEAEVVSILKAANDDALLTDGEGKRVMVWMPSAFVRLMALNWAEVMHSRVLELKGRDPCSPQEPVRIGQEWRLFPSWNRVGSTMFHDPAYLWNSTMQFELDLDLTEKILEIRKRLHENRESIDGGFSINSGVCKGQKWIFGKITDGFELTFSKKINWQVGEFLPSTLDLPDKYTSSVRQTN